MNNELAPNPQYWRTAQGKLIALSDMETSHVWNTAKMLYNQLADEYGFEPIYRSNRYIDFEVLAEEDPEAVARAIYSLAVELSKRTDRKPYMVIPMQKLQEALPNAESPDLAEGYDAISNPNGKEGDKT